MSNHSSNGFTLVELVITLAIAAILIGVAVPSFSSMVANARLRELVEPTRRALLLARSEATRSGVAVTVCPRRSNSQCGRQWDRGLLVFVDGDFDADENRANVDDDDVILTIVPPHDTRNSLKVFASNDRTANGEYEPNYIRYESDGSASWENGSLIACDERDEGKTESKHSRGMNVTLTGSVQTARPVTRGGAVRDVFGRAVDCS